MSEKPSKNKILRRILALGASIGVIGVSGAVFVTYAQDKTTPPTDTTTTAKPVATNSLTLNRAVAPVQVQSTQTSSATQQTAPSPAVSANSLPADRTAFRGDTVFGRPILQRRPLAPVKVDWQAAANTSSRMQPQRLAGGMAAKLQKAELDQTRLPVILPRDGGLIKSTQARLLSFGDAYALNMPQDNGMQVTAYGNRSVVPADSGAVSKRPVQKLLNVAEDVRISQMEDGWTATFTRYGVVYSIDVTCDDINAPDCQNDGFIRKAVAEFSDVAMGAQAQAEAQATIRPAQTSWIDNITSMFKPKGS